MLVLCPYPYGVAAGQRLKFEQYYDDWRAAGWQVDAAPFMDMALWRVLYERGHFAREVRRRRQKAMCGGCGTCSDFDATTSSIVTCT